jgi:hypothetical protein
MKIVRISGDDKLTWIDDTIGKHSNIKQAMKPIMDDNFMPFKDSEDKALSKICLERF